MRTSKKFGNKVSTESCSSHCFLSRFCLSRFCVFHPRHFLDPCFSSLSSTFPPLTSSRSSAAFLTITRGDEAHSSVTTKHAAASPSPHTHTLSLPVPISVSQLSPFIGSVPAIFLSAFSSSKRNDFRVANFIFHPRDASKSPCPTVVSSHLPLLHSLALPRVTHPILITFGARWASSFRAGARRQSE